MSHIYRPHHVQEHIRFAGKLISCSESTTAMFADAVTFGSVRITQEYVRAHSSEPVPDPASPGLNIPQCLAVLRDLKIAGSFDATGKTWPYLLDALHHNRRVMLQCRMDLLHSCAPGNVGHMILLQADDRKGHLLANDPMCDRASWLKTSDVKAAATAFADATGIPDGLRFAASRALPMVAG